MPRLRHFVRCTPLRLAEVGCGAIALLLPMSQSSGAAGFSAVGLLALTAVWLWGNETARTIAAGSVIANGAFLWKLGQPSTLALLWFDAVLLLACLLLGALDEAGLASIPRHRWRADATRFATGVACITIVAAATQLSGAPAWLPIGAMFAALGALLLARDGRVTPRRESPASMPANDG